MNFLAVRPFDPQLPRLLIRVVEGLHKTVDIIHEAIGDPLEHKIKRRLVAGQSESSVSPVIFANLIEILQNVLKSAVSLLDAVSEIDDQAEKLTLRS